MLAAALLLLSLQTPPEPAPREPAPSEAGTDVAGRQYKLGPDDVIKVTVYRHPDLAQELTVESDGSLDFPLIGRLPADGLTPRELEASIAERLAKGFVSEPQVRVAVVRYRSKTVFAMGELTHPGTYPLPEGRTLVEVLARAGPLLASAGAEVLVLRPPARTGAAAGAPQGPADPEVPQGEVIRVDLQELQTGLVSRNPSLRAGDTVFVPKAPRVYVSGEVRQPGAYNVLRGTTVRQAITLAGGFARRASRDRVRILRQQQGRTVELWAALEDPVSAGDTLVVEKKGIF